MKLTRIIDIVNLLEAELDKVTFDEAKEQLRLLRQELKEENVDNRNLIKPLEIK